MRKTFSRLLLVLSTPVLGFIPVGPKRTREPRSIPLQPGGNVIPKPALGIEKVPETFR
jgi:hypothetical protein